VFKYLSFYGMFSNKTDAPHIFSTFRADNIFMFTPRVDL
jgi:hypothetical protein